MATKIRVLVYRPGEPGVMEEILNTLAAQQKLVGGYIEAVGMGDNVQLICNEEGKLKRLPVNFRAPGDVLVGTVFFVRVDMEGECVSITAEDETRMRQFVGR